MRGGCCQATIKTNYTGAKSNQLIQTSMHQQHIIKFNNYKENLDLLLAFNQAKNKLIVSMIRQFLISVKYDKKKKTHIKNWEPLVSTPLLAIDSKYGLECFNARFSSAILTQSIIVTVIFIWSRVFLINKNTTPHSWTKSEPFQLQIQIFDRNKTSLRGTSHHYPPLLIFLKKPKRI